MLPTELNEEQQNLLFKIEKENHKKGFFRIEKIFKLNNHAYSRHQTKN